MQAVARALENRVPEDEKERVTYVRFMALQLCFLVPWQLLCVMDMVVSKGLQ